MRTAELVTHGGFADLRKTRTRQSVQGVEDAKKINELDQICPACGASAHGGPRMPGLV